MKIILFLLFFALSVLTNTLIAKPHDCGKTPTTAAGGHKTWCQCFHQNMIEGCFLQDGSVDICTDEHIRRIVQPQFSAFLKKHGNRSSDTKMRNLYFYFHHCPIVKPSFTSSRYFFIENLNRLTKKQFKNHVLLIGLDGVRTDAFQRVYQTLKKQHRDKYFLQLMAKTGINNHFYAGGIQGTKTEQPTLSESGWVSILTGVWTDQHHLKQNGDLASNKYNRDIPTIYNILRDTYPGSIVASFSDWKPISIFATYRYHGDNNANINLFYDPSDYAAFLPADRQMTHDVIGAMKEKVIPLFIYVRYGYSDETGHLFKFSTDSKKYLGSIRQEINEANLLLRSIVHLKKKNWLIIITTDHGGHEYTHGSQMPDDRNIFAVVGTYGRKGFRPYKIADGKHGMIKFVNFIKTYLNN